jgi:hypothetical protein
LNYFLLHCTAAETTNKSQTWCPNHKPITLHIQETHHNIPNYIKIKHKIVSGNTHIDYTSHTTTSHTPYRAGSGNTNTDLTPNTPYRAHASTHTHTPYIQFMLRSRISSQLTSFSSAHSISTRSSIRLIGRHPNT